MKVTRIEAVPVAYPEPNDNNATRHLLLARLETDSGHVGWGEAVTMWPEATQAAAVILDALAPLLLHRDPTEHTALWAELKQHTWWYGAGGIASFAIAALDIALWDLAGQATNRPLIDQLGGPAHDSLPVIISCHAMHANLEQMTADMTRWVRDHHAAGIKIGFGKRGNANLGNDSRRDLEFVRLLRTAVGDDTRIMIDLGASIHWDSDTAAARAQDWEPYNIAWIEEPLGPDNPTGYRRLKQHTRIPIAYGEREWTPRGIERILDTGTVDIVGVDPGRLEGVTGFQQASAAAARHGAQINAHAWSSAIVTAASLAASLAAPHCRQIEIKPLRNPMQHEIVRNPVAPHDGVLIPLSAPGLGIIIDEAALRRYQLMA